MTARNPLVVVSGSVEELPPGDTVNGASGGSSNVFPVRNVDFVTDDTSPPSGLTDLSAYGGPTLVNGDHVAAYHGLWAVSSGTWTLVHTWAVGDVVVGTWPSWSDPISIQQGAIYIYEDDGAGLGPANYGQIQAAVATIYFSGLADVDYTTPPQGGDLFMYDSHSGKIVPLLSTTNAPTEGDALRYGATSGPGGSPGYFFAP